MSEEETKMDTEEDKTDNKTKNPLIDSNIDSYKSESQDAVEKTIYEMSKDTVETSNDAQDEVYELSEETFKNINEDEELSEDVLMKPEPEYPLINPPYDPTGGSDDNEMLEISEQTFKNITEADKPSEPLIEPIEKDYCQTICEPGEETSKIAQAEAGEELTEGTFNKMNEKEECSEVVLIKVKPKYPLINPPSDPTGGSDDNEMFEISEQTFNMTDIAEADEASGSLIKTVEKGFCQTICEPGEKTAKNAQTEAAHELTDETFINDNEEFSEDVLIKGEPEDPLINPPFDPAGGCDDDEVYEISEETFEKINADVFCEMHESITPKGENTATHDLFKNLINQIIQTKMSDEVSEEGKSISTKNTSENNHQLLTKSELGIKIVDIKSEADHSQVEDLLDELGIEIKDDEAEVVKENILQQETTDYCTDTPDIIENIETETDAQVEYENIVIDDNNESVECMDLEEIPSSPDQKDGLEKYDTDLLDNEHFRLSEKQGEIKEKFKIVNNILQVCKDIKNKDKKIKIPSSTVSTLHFFTNINSSYIREVLNRDKRDRSLKKAILDTKYLPANIEPHIYNDVRDVFVELYVQKGLVPNKINFMETFQAKSSPINLYNDMKLRTLVKNNLVDYKYFKFEESSKHILTENPELSYLRNKYLRQIIRMRDNGARFTYISIMPLTKHRELRGMAASPTTGLIDQFEAHLKDTKRMKNWLQLLLHSLDPESIIVLTQPELYNTTPTANSTKDEMMKWLNKREVIFELDYHRAELYTLIKLYKEDNKGMFDGVLKSAGFKFITSPVQYPTLNYFYPIYLEYASLRQPDRINTFMNVMGQADWMILEDMMSQEERQMMKEDRQMEKAVENIVEMMKNGVLNEEDFPEECNASKYDKFEVNIGDIIVD